MAHKKDVLLTCLEFGYTNRDTGVSYNDTVQHLLSQGLIINDFAFNRYFYVWFFDNFYHSEIYYNKIVKTSGSHPYLFNQVWMKPGVNTQLDDKCFMTFEARQQWLDYLSLMESDRKADAALVLTKQSTLLTESSNELSKKAIKISWWAIGLTFISLIASIVIGIIQICQTPDVNTVILSSPKYQPPMQDTLSKSNDVHHDTIITKPTLNLTKDSTNLNKQSLK